MFPRDLPLFGSLYRLNEIEHDIECRFHATLDFFECSIA